MRPRFNAGDLVEVKLGKGLATWRPGTVRKVVPGGYVVRVGRDDHELMDRHVRALKARPAGARAPRLGKELPPIGALSPDLWPRPEEQSAPAAALRLARPFDGVPAEPPVPVLPLVAAPEAVSHHWAPQARPVPKPSGPWRNDAYLAFVRSKPCCACGAKGPSEAHHWSRRRGERGVSTKVSDALTVPLCTVDHRSFHDRGHVRGLDAEQTKALFFERQHDLFREWIETGGKAA